MKPTRKRAVQPDDAAAERVVDELDEDAHADREERQPELTDELPPGAQVEVVVEDAERGRQGAAEEQGDDARRIDGARDRQVVGVDVGDPDGGRGNDEGDGDGHAAAARNGGHVDPPMVGMVDRVEAEGDPPDERREDEGEDGGRGEGGEKVGKRLTGERTEPHAAGSPVGIGGPVEARDREAGTDLGDALSEAGLLRGVVAMLDRVDDQAADLSHLVRAHATRRHRRGSDPDPRRGVGRLAVERDLVLVDGDPDLVEQVLGVLAGHAERHHVGEHQVVVGAARDEAGAAAGQRLGENRCVLDRPALIAPELVAEGELEGHRLARDDVHERPALDAGEDRLVDRRRERGLDGRESRRVDRRSAARGG